jgi:hypothetical protein
VTLVRAADDVDLAAWLTYIDGDARCPCAHRWKLCTGILYGISMGPGWVRVTTEPGCPHHGSGRLAE